MSGMAQLAAALAGGLTGYVKGEQITRDWAREDQDTAFKSEQRDRLRKDWATQDAIDSAAAPTTVQEQTFRAPTTGPTADAPMVTRFDTAGATFADKAKADAAARQYNAPVMTFGRQRDEAAKRGRADLAKSYEDFAKHAESNGFMALHALNAPVGISAEDIKAGKVPDADVMGLDEFNKTGAYAIPDGAKRRFVLDDMGRPDYILVGPDGKQIGALSGGQIQRVYDKATYRQDRVDTVSRQDKEADNARADARQAAEQKRWEAQMAEVARHNRAVEGVTMARATGAGQAQPPAPVWSEKADETLLKHYTVLDPTTGAKDLDGEGLQFGKQVALARARGLGGDTTMAIGFAVAKDAALKKAAGGDPEKLRQLRAGYLASIMGQGGAQQPPTPAPSPQPQPAPKPAQQGPSMSQVAGPRHPLMRDLFKPQVVDAFETGQDGLSDAITWVGKRALRQPN